MINRKNIYKFQEIVTNSHPHIRNITLPLKDFTSWVQSKVKRIKNEALNLCSKLTYTHCIQKQIALLNNYKIQEIMNS